MSHKKILSAMSGGVDSAVAAALLVRDGYEVCGGTLRLLPSGVPVGDCGNPREAEDARAVCAVLGIPHHVIDGTEAFQNAVTTPFTQSYRQGLTPNPCLLCNKNLKFGLLLDWALAHGFDAVATGHYVRARFDETSGRWQLLRAAHPEKDQSYALYGLSQNRLARAIFPLGALSKADTRRIAGELALPVAQKPDSQDICFVPDGDYARFIRAAVPGEPPLTGGIVTADGMVLGRHDGIDRFTIGQRKGLGGLGRPMYVLAKNPVTGTVTVGPDEALYAGQCEVRDVNWIIEPPDAPFRAHVKTRYTSKSAPAAVYPRPDGARVEFDAPQRALTPGQAAVFYDGEIVLGGGEIAGSV